MGLPLLLIAVLPLVVFAPLALLYGVFYVHDVQHYFYPYHVATANLVADGHLPLWNPYAFSGMPLIGDGQTAIFYPPNWLFFIAPGNVALNYAILLQFSIAGVGTYLLARSLGLHLLPSFVAAIAYMFSGFLTARSVHLSIQSGAALAPLVFFTVERALRPGASLRWFAAAAVTLGLQAVTGHPQVPIYTALGIGLFAMVLAITRARVDHDWRWLYRLPLRLAVMYALGYALAAVQLLPWVELGRLSPRAASADFEFVFEGSMNGAQWLLFFFPYLYGSLQPGFYGTGLGVEGITQLWEHSAYVGILSLGLVIVAIGGTFGRGNAQRAYVVAFVLVLIGALLMAAGNNTPFGEFIYATPLVGKLRQVERSLALADLALVMLAGLGMEQLLTRRAEESTATSWSAIVAAVVLVAIPAGVLVLAQYPEYQGIVALEPNDFDYIQITRPNTYIPLTLAVSSAALLLWWSRRPLGGRSEIFAAGLLLLDLTAFAAPFNPVAEPDLYDRVPESVEFIRNRGGLYRKITFLPSAWLDTNVAQDLAGVSWGMTYGLEDANGFNSLQTRRYTDYLFSPHDDDVSYGQWADQRLLRAGSPILSSLNVRYVLIPAKLQPPIGPQFWQVFEDESVKIYENTDVYPRAFFAEVVTQESDPRTVLRTVTANGFDGRRTAVVEATDPPPISSGAASTDDVLITRYGPNDIALETTTDGPRFLVSSEMHFPGWSAYVDGRETEIYRTNYLFRGIVVPAGAHKIRFAYRPASVIAGAGISAAALALVGALMMLSSGRSSSQASRNSTITGA